MPKRHKKKNAKRQKAKDPLEKSCQNRQAGWRKEENKRGRWWERRRAEESVEALGYEWLSAVARCRIRTFLSFSLTLRRARPIFGASPGPQVVVSTKYKHKSGVSNSPLCFVNQAVLQTVLQQ